MTPPTPDPAAVERLEAEAQRHAGYAVTRFLTQHPGNDWSPKEIADVAVREYVARRPSSSDAERFLGPLDDAVHALRQATTDLRVTAAVLHEIEEGTETVPAYCRSRDANDALRRAEKGLRQHDYDALLTALREHVAQRGQEG